jgi:hypothetical protein
MILKCVPLSNPARVQSHAPCLSGRESQHRRVAHPHLHGKVRGAGAASLRLCDRLGDELLQLRGSAGRTSYCSPGTTGAANRNKFQLWLRHVAMFSLQSHCRTTKYRRIHRRSPKCLE